MCLGSYGPGGAVTFESLRESVVQGAAFSFLGVLSSLLGALADSEPVPVPGPPRGRVLSRWGASGLCRTCFYPTPIHVEVLGDLAVGMWEII